MYTYVETKQNQDIFYELVEEVWKETFGDEGMENVFKGNSDKVILRDKKNNPIGTCEFIDYHPATSLMAFDFFQIEKIRKSDKVIEIDKLAVSSKARGLSHLRTALFAMREYAIANDVEYFVATIQGVLLRILSARYGLPVEIVGEDISVHDSKGNIVGKEIPVIIPIKDIIKNTKKIKFEKDS